MRAARPALYNKIIENYLILPLFFVYRLLWFQLKLQATMTASVGQYTQSVEQLLDFVRKNLIANEKRGHGKPGLRMEMGLPMMGGRPGKQKSSRFRPHLFRKADKSEPKSNGSVGGESSSAYHE